MVGGGQAGTSPVLPAWADVQWDELLLQIVKLVGKGAITQRFRPAIGFRFITSNQLIGK